MKDRAGKEKKLVDMVPLSRLNYVLYAGIFVLTIAVTYFVMAEYFLYSGQRGNEFLSVEVASNGVENFADGFHPFIVITAEAKEKSVIEIHLSSKSYNTKYKSEEDVTEYTVSAILPNTAYSTEFNITVEAKMQDGRVYRRITRLTTKESPDVMFKVG